MSGAVFPTLETARLHLRRFMDRDLLSFMAYRNDPDVAKYQSWTSISAYEAQAFIERQKSIQPGRRGQGIQIALELKETEQLIGDCFFMLNVYDKRQAEIGYTIARAYQQQGFATEAVSSLLTYAFATFQLHRITAIVDCENTASVALLERLGLRREGHFMQNIWFKGKWGDEYLYAILREEWLKPRSL